MDWKPKLRRRPGLGGGAGTGDSHRPWTSTDLPTSWYRRFCFCSFGPRDRPLPRCRERTPSPAPCGRLGQRGLGPYQCTEARLSGCGV